MFFAGILKVNDENSRIRIQDPDPLLRGMDPRIRIHPKMSWIRNTDGYWLVLGLNRGRCGWYRVWGKWTRRRRLRVDWFLPGPPPDFPPATWPPSRVGVRAAPMKKKADHVAVRCRGSVPSIAIVKADSWAPTPYNRESAGVSLPQRRCPRNKRAG